MKVEDIRQIAPTVAAEFDHIFETWSSTVEVRDRFKGDMITCHLDELYVKVQEARKKNELDVRAITAFSLAKIHAEAAAAGKSTPVFKTRVPPAVTMTMIKSRGLEERLQKLISDSVTNPEDAETVTALGTELNKGLGKNFYDALQPLIEAGKVKAESVAEFQLIETESRSKRAAPTTPKTPRAKAAPVPPKARKATVDDYFIAYVCDAGEMDLNDMAALCMTNTDRIYTVLRWCIVHQLGKERYTITSSTPIVKNMSLETRVTVISNGTWRAQYLEGLKKKDMSTNGAAQAPEGEPVETPPATETSAETSPVTTEQPTA